jgi:hypothetical protein
VFWDLVQRRVVLEWVSPLTVTSMAGYDEVDDDDVDIRVRRRRQPIEELPISSTLCAISLSLMDLV